MTTLHILDSDFEIIKKYIALGREKFNLTINIEKNTNNSTERKYKPLSSSLDKKIRNAKSVNTDKALKVKNAMETLNFLLDSNKKNLTLEEAKEQYFNNKANKIGA